MSLEAPQQHDPSHFGQNNDRQSPGPQDVPPPPPLSAPYSALAGYCAQLPNSSINSFCGAMGGVASGIVTCPLDVIKTKLQAQGAFRPGQRQANTSAIYHGLLGTGKTIWKEDGIRGMYRGLGPMLLGYLPTWAVYMSVYEGSRDYYYTKTENKWDARIYASVTAGACSTLATNPIWVIKTRLMSQVSPKAAKDTRTPWYYHGTLDAARKMYQNEGIKVFYSGLGPAMLGLTHVAIQFPLYEFLKMEFTGLGMGENNPSDDTGSHWLGITAATFLSKVCATSATYPHEVLRTRLQTQQRALHPSTSLDEVAFRGSYDRKDYPKAAGSSNSDGTANRYPRYRGLIKTAEVILREEGWRSFYSGMGTNMVRAVPAAMTTMLTFEFLKKTMTSVQEDGQRILEEEKSHTG